MVHIYAQYGSDAIAGVINVNKKATNKLDINILGGTQQGDLMM
jgi:outer membrane cobalamin receptor